MALTAMRFSVVLAYMRLRLKFEGGHYDGKQLAGKGSR